jgi:hypothetical protein
MTARTGSLVAAAVVALAAVASAEPQRHAGHDAFHGQGTSRPSTEFGGVNRDPSGGFGVYRDPRAGTTGRDHVNEPNPVYRPGAPLPAPGPTWVPGFWWWDGYQWVWYPGHWR